MSETQQDNTPEEAASAPVPIDQTVDLSATESAAAESAAAESAAAESAAAESATVSGSGTTSGDETADALIVARVADDFRGADIILLDMRKITPIVDFFVIATASSKRQMKAMAEETDIVMKKRGSTRRGAEGEGESVWILRDYGHVVLHVFTPEGRQLYALENLWADAPQVDWRE